MPLRPKLIRQSRQSLNDAVRMGTLVLCHAALDNLLLSIVRYRVAVDPLARDALLSRLSEKRVSARVALDSRRKKLELILINGWLSQMGRESLPRKYDELIALLGNDRAKWKHASITEWLKSIDIARHDVIHESRKHFRRVDYKWFTETLSDFGMLLCGHAKFPPFNDDRSS